MFKLFLFILSHIFIFSSDFHEKECAFCTTAVIDYQKFYEDDLLIVLYTHKPIMPGHCLIIPKRHAERFEHLSDLEALRIFQVIKKVDIAVREVFQTSSYLILQKNGTEVGQTVSHVHFHYIPRQAGDSSVIKFLFRMFVKSAQSPISPKEMQDVTEKKAQAIESQNN